MATSAGRDIGDTKSAHVAEHPLDLRLFKGD
jgi:hypothetical protein